MKKILITIITLLITFIPVMAESFSDVPQDHWSYDAVQLLEEKGLVEGYPDGLFRGDRPMTRYEMAMVVARIVAKLEQIEASVPQMPDLSIYAAKEDLEIINKLLDEFRAELEALGIRVTNIEDSLMGLNSRMEELERVFISGDITVVANSFGFTTEPPVDPANPDLPPLVFEDYAGFGLTHGYDISTRLNLDVGVHVNDSVIAGGTLAAYSFFGDSRVTYYWGILPPFTPSGFTEEGLSPPGSNFRTNLNKLWFQTSGDWEITGIIGEFQPEEISPLVYYGVVAPDAWAPDSVPVNGIDFRGTLYEKFKFEVFKADDLTWAGAGPQPVFNGENPYDLFSSDFYQNEEGYHSRMYGGLFGYEDEKWNFDVSCVRIYEDRASRPNSSLIPKEEVMLDFRGSYRISDACTFTGEFAQSWFDYNLLDSSSNSERGTALILGGEGYISNFDYEAKFLRIDGNYEPFSFRKIFNNTDEEAYIMSYYIPNRIGFYGRMGYYFDSERGRIDGGAGYFTQIDPTLDIVPETTIGSSYGFQDHSFINSSTDKGSEFHWDIGGYYDITEEWSFRGRFLSINFDRDYPDYHHDQTRNFLFLEAGYKITEKFSVHGQYKIATVKGINDSGIDTDITLHIPGISLRYEFNEDTAIGIAYRHYNNNDNLDIDNVFGVNRITTWMTVSF